MLPEGQDPDDLVRSGGREAVAEVLGGARPLADMLWMRETEAGGFDTPERRAALEARLAEVTRGDRRRDRAQILPPGLRRRGCGSCSTPTAAGAAASRGAARRATGAAAWPQRSQAAGAAPFARRPRSAPAAPAAASPMWSRARSSPPARCIAAIAPPFRAREALILQAVDQPSLAAARPPGGTRRASSSATPRPSRLQARADRHRRPTTATPTREAHARRARPRAGCAELLARDREGASPHASDWGARPEAAPGRRADDVESACRLASAMALPN